MTARRLQTELKLVELYTQSWPAPYTAALRLSTILAPAVIGTIIFANPQPRTPRRLSYI